MSTDYITRSMEELVVKLNQQYPALLITGPRQVGKTTMLEKLIEQKGQQRTKVTLDNLADRQLARTDCEKLS